MMNSSGNVGIALTVSCIAGLSTAVGASVVFIPALVGLANHKTLAGSLAFSAGVMVYLSFVELLSDSTDKFMKAGNTKWIASLYSAACFFSGIIIMVVSLFQISICFGGDLHGCANISQILNFVVKILTRSHHHAPADEDDSRADSRTPRSITVDLLPKGVCPCDTDIEVVRNMAQEIEQLQRSDRNQPWEGTFDTGNKGVPSLVRLEGDDENGKNAVEKSLRKENRRRLMLTSINNCLAISLHNFPEGTRTAFRRVSTRPCFLICNVLGLATFVSTLSDPSVGAVLGVAVMIHNIPEGKKVACGTPQLAA